MGITVKPHDTKVPTAIDLFCGAGGFTVGLLRAGFDVLCGVDLWDKAIESYKLNFSHPCLQGDILELTGTKIRTLTGIGERPIDLVVGGPPCQGFSIQRVGPDSDNRNNLVIEFARLIKDLIPQMFLMENVPGLLGKRGRRLIETFMKFVADAGFEAEAHVVNAAEYGVPQIRKRVIVIGWRKEAFPPFVLPQPTTTGATMPSAWQAISDLPPPPEAGQPCSDPLHKKTKLSKLNQERLKHIPPGGGMEHLPVNLRAACHKGGADRIGHRYVYGRLAPNRPAATITARFDSFTRGRFAHPFENRNITLREGARLQTFEDSFLFAGNQEDIAAQIGNAMPPALAEVLGLAIRRHLTGELFELHTLMDKPKPRLRSPNQIDLFERKIWK